MSTRNKLSNSSTSGSLVHLKKVLLATTASTVILVSACTGSSTSDEDDSAPQVSLEETSERERAAPVVADAYRGQAFRAAGAMSKQSGFVAQLAPQPRPGTIDRERYEDFEQNPVRVVSEDPVSTFSVDVDTASYGVMRRYLNDGILPPMDAVRVEELVNYFDYAYELPATREQPFKANTWLYETPWNAETQILHVGIKGFDIIPEERPDANLVLLIDVSGSMGSENKLPLLKKAMRLLVDQMSEDDTVSMVVYAGAAGTVLEPTKGSDKAKILGALERLESGGSTAGGEGIRQAYALAEANFVKDGVNRVILATDGDFNVGIADPERLEDFVATKRETGVYLTALGFGAGNYNDVLMQKIAQAGNGNAAYIDSLKEARKVLVDEMGSTLFPIAKDVKIQIEFNPAEVAEYRLIGYETRMLNREDFNNDKVDSGDIGSGHSVTALYEIVPTTSKTRFNDPLRYSDKTKVKSSSNAGEVAFVKIRYKLPDEDTSRLIEKSVLASSLVANTQVLSDDVRFASAVASYGQYLKGGIYTGDMKLDEILELAQGSKGDDDFGYRSEFIQLVRLASSAEVQETLGKRPKGENGGKF